MQLSTENTTWKEQFLSHGGWVTRFTINGEDVGGDYNADDDRADLFAKSYPHGPLKVLELGSLEGGHSFALSQLNQVAQLVCIEGREINLWRARFMQQLTRSYKPVFLQANLEKFPLSSLGRFDVIFCVGLLYHLPTPWDLLKKLSRLSSKLFIWTHYTDKAEVTAKGYGGRWYEEHGQADPLSGLSKQSFWPTRTELFRMLGHYGYHNIQVLTETQQNNASAITLTAHMD